MTLAQTLDFLRELAQHNEKAWFDAHREQYKQARAAFEGLVADLIHHFEPVDDLGNVTPQECMFRINRDVRFSKNKSPYNSHMSAALARGGRKSEGRSYYLQIAPGASFIAGGVYDPDKAALDNIRKHLVMDARPFRKIINAPNFVRYFGAIQGDTLKTAPSGYDKQHPEVDLLRHKQFLAVHTLSNADVTAKEFVSHVIDVCAALKPFIIYLDESASAPPANVNVKANPANQAEF